jgi:hypothetical protein
MSWKDFFWVEGCKLMGHNTDSSFSTGQRRFREFFGVSPLVCQEIWYKVLNQLPSGAKAKHLLWTLFFLKRYNTEAVNRKVCGSDEKSFRKWTWIFIDLISDLEVVIIFSFTGRSL